MYRRDGDLLDAHLTIRELCSAELRVPMQVAQQLLRTLPENKQQLVRSSYRGLRRSWRELKGRAADFALNALQRYSSSYGLNRELSREAAAVSAGRLRYEDDCRRVGAPTSFLLRRNIHRLEKGLIMRPRRSVFAYDYIGETVEAFVRAAAGGESRQAASDEVLWARDVLGEYFAVVDKGDPLIAAAHRRFLTAKSPACAEEWQRAVPYRRDLEDSRLVSFESFLNLCRQRRSVRWYLDRPVPRDLVDLALQAAAQAPSACNRQPFVFRIFDDCQKVRKVAGILLGTRGFEGQLPAIAVLVGRLRAFPLPRDRHAIYIDAALSAMSFMFALETLGLASCVLNWADQEPQESMIREALNLEPDERVVMCVAYGWPDPDGMVPYSAKRPLDQLRSYS